LLLRAETFRTSPRTTLKENAKMTTTMQGFDLAEIQKRVGNVPESRIRRNPYPASVQDVIEIEAREGRLCELIDGVLVEKAMGAEQSDLARELLTNLTLHNRRHRLGVIYGVDGAIKLPKGIVHIPDVSFTLWDRLPGRKKPKESVPQIVPNLVVEVLSDSNTADEIEIKREEYFNSGVQLVWEIDPQIRTITVWTSLKQSQVLHLGDTLMGEPVLPSFSLSLEEFFATLDEQG
jgi:Uma2 family endonuclease